MTEGYEPQDPDKPRYPPGTIPPFQPGYHEGGGLDSPPDTSHPYEPGYHEGGAADGAEDDPSGRPE